MFEVWSTLAVWLLIAPVAQWLERLPDTQEVEGSSPAHSTNRKKYDRNYRREIK